MYLLLHGFIVFQESMMELSRCLLDSLSQEGLSVKLTGKLARPSAQQLTAFLHQFRSVSSLTVLLINSSSIRGSLCTFGAGNSR